MNEWMSERLKRGKRELVSGKDEARCLVMGFGDDAGLDILGGGQGSGGE